MAGGADKQPAGPDAVVWAGTPHKQARYLHAYDFSQPHDAMMAACRNGKPLMLEDLRLDAQKSRCPKCARILARGGVAYPKPVNRFLCPLCDKEVAVKTHDGREYIGWHGFTRVLRGTYTGDPCPTSGHNESELPVLWLMGWWRFHWRMARRDERYLPVNHVGKSCQTSTS